VAFIGADWSELLSECRGRLRVICWLSSTSTNPHAVKEMMSHSQTEVRQRHGMHCKVYLSPTAAVVGSANLSKGALTEQGNSGQHEGAIWVTVPSVVREIHGWFDWLWRDRETRRIGDADLVCASAAWRNAQRARQLSGIRTTAQGATKVGTPAQEHPQWPDSIEEALNVLRHVLRKGSHNSSLDFVYDPLPDCKYMNVSEDGQLLLPDRPSSYDQPIRLTVNQESIKITTLTYRGSEGVRQRAVASLLAAGFQPPRSAKAKGARLGRTDTNKARLHPAIRLEGLTETELQLPAKQAAIQYLFGESMREWRSERQSLGTDL
jgi:hypothetical protein